MPAIGTMVPMYQTLKHSAHEKPLYFPSVSVDLQPFAMLNLPIETLPLPGVQQPNPPATE
jgi:hypothetical protein